MTATATKTDLSKQPPAIQMLNSESVKNQIQMAIPRSVSKQLTPDRMARIAMTEFRKSPGLAKCEPKSIVGAIIQSAQIGLEPGGALGHCYLVPYGKECQLIIGYRGMIDLARRSGQIQQINAWVVRDGDLFEYSFGLKPDILHKPDPSAKPDPTGKDIEFVYAVAHLNGGGIQFDVMSREEIDQIRAQSKAGNSGPWKTHYAEMAKKTVVRRLFKMLPVSLEIQQAVGLDEQADVGKQQNDAVLDGEYSYVDPEVSEADSAIETAPDNPDLAAVINSLRGATDRQNLDLILADSEMYEFSDDQKAQVSAVHAECINALSSKLEMDV